MSEGLSISRLPLPPPLPPVLRPWISLNSEFGVLLCLGNGCQRVAGNPLNLSRHLRDKHITSKEVRKEAATYTRLFYQYYQYNPSQIRLPLDGSLPQPVLPILDGYHCHACLYRSRNRNVIREHVNKLHGNLRALDQEIFKAVRLQTWAGTGNGKYWVVREINDGLGNGIGSGSRDDQIIAAVAEWSKEAQEERLILNHPPATVEFDPWLRYTGWYNVLSQSKHNLLTTANFIRLPDPDEWQLSYVLQSWGRILKRCLTTLEATDQKDILKWWASPKKESVSQAPFEQPDSHTINRYSWRWQLFLCYMMRTAPPDHWDGETETHVTYTRGQWDCIKRIRGIFDIVEDRAMAEGVAVAEIHDLAELDTSLMALLISIVTQDTSYVSLYSSPLLHFLAVCGINPKTKTLYTAFLYTPTLAQVLWIIRLLVLEIALPLQSWPSLGLLAKEEIPSIPRQVSLIRERYLIEGSFSPASSILSQLAYGKAIAKHHRNPPNIHWSDDRQCVFYLGQGVAMAKIRTMWVQLFQELRDILFELLFHQPVDPVPLPQLIDHMGTSQGSHADGYSFVDHPANQATCKRDWQFLYTRMLYDTDEWRLVCSGSGGQREWIEIRRKAYLNRERHFLRRLMVAIHIASGQPARGPELGSIKVVNTLISLRSIYVLNGRVVFLTTYDKSKKRRGNTEYILRCMPLPLGQIVAQYLVYVRPFSQVVSKTKQDYLFSDGQTPWAGSQLSSALAEVTPTYLGIRLTTSSWRQIAIAIANEYLGKASKLWEQGDSDRDDAEFGSGDDEAETERNVLQSILIRQSAHGRRVAERHYAIDGAFLTHLRPELIHAYSQASRAWHALFYLEPEGLATAVAETRVKHSREASQQLQSSLPKRDKKSQVGRATATPPTFEGFYRLYGPKARPRSEAQAAALTLVHATSKQTATTIIVMATGSGKSLLFFSLAALAVNQTVVVVVPYTALVNNLVERAQTAGSGSGSGISCQEWTKLNPTHALPQLLIVSADRAVQDDFLHFAQGLAIHGQLLHVFFDECHVALTDTSYREQLRKLWQLRHLNCPFTCLTATLLLSLEETLQERLLIQGATIFRRSTMRPTIQYKVIESPARSIMKDAQQFIKSLPLPQPAPLVQRGIIYVRAYHVGTQLQEVFGFPFYNARADSKDEVLDAWTSGPGGWMIATGALGTGVDLSGIAYVVHIDRPYGLTNFMQQSGRGGRGGEPSTSIVFVKGDGGGSPYYRPLANQYSVEAEDEIALDRFLWSQNCRREVLAREFDGVTSGASCITTNSAYCDRCQVYSNDHINNSSSRSGSGSPDLLEVTGSKAIATMLHQHAIDNEALIQVMDRLSRFCVYCEFMLASGEAGDHIHQGCLPAKAAECSLPTYWQWRRQLVLAVAGQCFRCGLGDEFCKAVEEKRPCAYRHIMLPAFWFTFRQTYTIEQICQHHGWTGEYNSSSNPRDKAYGPRLWQWLGQIEEGGGVAQRELRWMRVWRELCRLYQETSETQISEE